jgi:hypothetical protein
VLHNLNTQGRALIRDSGADDQVNRLIFQDFFGALRLPGLGISIGKLRAEVWLFGKKRH